MDNVLENVPDSIKFTTKNPYNFKNVPLDDPRVWALYCRGDTKGTFQTESKLATDWCKAIKPHSVQDLSDIIALIRPGCLESGETEKYSKRKNSESPIEYIHPSLEPILKDTQGIFVYQEQILSAVQTLAGFSEMEADLLRIAMGKKLPEEMAKMKLLFAEKAESHGLIDKEKAIEIFDIIEKSQRYLFNHCLVPETIVEKEDGSIVTLKALKTGDKIKCLQDGQIIFAKVLNIFNNGIQKIYKIRTKDLHSIKCTNTHKFLCEDGIVRPLLEIIIFNHRMMTRNGPSRITSYIQMGNRQTLDIEVDTKDHLYYANGIIISNSHSVSYALTSYYAAYAKVHFPTEFYCSWLTFSNEKPEPKEEVRALVINAKNNGITVTPPDIDVKNIDFKITGDKTIAFGLSHIRSIGPSSVKKVLGVIDFTPTWNDFLIRVPDIKRSSAQALIKGGALDKRYGMERTEMLRQIHLVYGFSDKNADNTNDAFKSLTGKEFNCFKKNIPKGMEEAFKSIITEKGCVKKRIPVIEAKIAELPNYKKDTNRQKSIWEKIFLGVSLSCNATDDFNIEYEKGVKTCKEVFSQLLKEKGEKFILHACIDKLELKKTGPKSKTPGQEYVYMTASDGTGILDNLVCWPNVYVNYAGQLFEDQVVVLNVRRDFWGSREQLSVEKITIIG